MVKNHIKLKENTGIKETKKQDEAEHEKSYATLMKTVLKRTCNLIILVSYNFFQNIYASYYRADQTFWVWLGSMKSNLTSIY